MMKTKLKAVSLSAATLLMGTMAVKAPTGGAPQFTDIHTTEGGSIALTLSGVALTGYTIEATTNLASAFSPIGAVVTDSQGTASFTDVGTLGLNPQRFYRAQQIQGP